MPKDPYLEGRILLAIEAYNQNQFKSLRAAAASFNVSRSTLSNRLNGMIARRDTRPVSCKLSSVEEEVLHRRILDLDSQGYPPRLAVVREMADLILQNRKDLKPTTVGVNWTTNFVNRHPDLKTKFNRKYDHQRAKCENPVVISEWFRLVRNTTLKYGILDGDIYNFDETGFQMGIIGTEKVVTGAERRSRPKTLQPGN